MKRLTFEDAQKLNVGDRVFIDYANKGTNENIQTWGKVAVKATTNKNENFHGTMYCWVLVTYKDGNRLKESTFASHHLKR